ncbi:MAG: hypothetical protein IKT08_08620 [Bacteroidales bacterium]|nr:hypothetical protein [Bacteroidales bacterium]
MKKNFCKILCFVTMACFVLVFVQEKWRPFEPKPLAGVNFTTEFPAFTLENYTSGNLQRDLEQYSKENFGFREWAIRLYNQYSYSCFNKTYCHFIVPGKDGYLFYTEAFSEYYGIEPLHFYKTYDNARKWARKNVGMMNKLRYVLKEYGIEFLCFMAPDKAEIYSEYLPYHEPPTPDVIHTAAYYDSLMTAIDFPHVEMTKWYQAMKDTASFPLFPKRDTHWRYSAVFGYDSLFSYMDNLNHFGIPDIHVNKLIKLDTMYPENDEQTLNLMFPIGNDSPKYRADITVDCGEGCRKPKVLFVGDSFIWDLETYMPWKEILEDVEIWFYNKSAFVGFEKEKHPITEINRLRSILNADYVVWYSSGYQWSRASYNFVEDALLLLCVSDSLFDAQIPWVMDSLQHDVCEDSLRAHAIKTLKNNPELIPGLDGDAMPTIRNTQAIALAQQANAIANDKQWNVALHIQASRTGRLFDDILDEEAENVLSGRPLIRQEIQVDTASIIEFEVGKLMDQWRNNEESIKFLENKAQERGVTFEEILEADARWVVNEKLANGELF